jgi:hypothetical protein
MFDVIADLPDGVVGVSISGTIDSEDYETTLIPLIDAAVERFDMVAMLLVFGEEFRGYTAAAAWDDMRFGVSNFNSFRRIAIVSDNEWLRNGATAMTYLMPGRSKGFAVEDLEEAKEWVADLD